MSNLYEVGDLVRVYGTFTDQAGTAIDPTDVFFSFKNPSKTITTYKYGVDAKLVKSATGVYYVDINANNVGIWYYRFYSTGTRQTANEGLFTVPVTNF